MTTADSGHFFGAASVTSESGGRSRNADSGQEDVAPARYGSGHTRYADSGHTSVATAVPHELDHKPIADSGQRRSVALASNGGQPRAAGNGHTSCAAAVVQNGHSTRADSGQYRLAVLDNLVTQCRLREDYHRAEKRLILQVKSICRRRSGGKGKVADDLFTSLSKQPDPETQGLFLALNTLRDQRKLYEKAVQRLAKELPVTSWIETVPGVSFLSVGLLVAELEPVLTVGHLADADSGHEVNAHRRHQESRARYRLGLALVEGERQRKVKDKALAERMGYSPRRRSIMWNIGSCMIKAANRDSGPYYDIYLHRKEFEMARGIKRGHAHNRAARYMTTKFLRHFLAAWNAAANTTTSEVTKVSLSPRLARGHPHEADSGQGMLAP